MIDDIVTGIAKALKTVKDIPIYYNDDVKQGIETPCFFIDFIRITETPRLYPRFHRDQPFDLHYIPSEDGKRKELYDTAEEMCMVLDFVEGNSGDQYRGTKIRHEIIDGVLHIFVNYNAHVRRPITAETSMEEIRYEPKIQGE